VATRIFLERPVSDGVFFFVFFFPTVLMLLLFVVAGIVGFLKYVIVRIFFVGPVFTITFSEFLKKSRGSPYNGGGPSYVIGGTGNDGGTSNGLTCSGGVTNSGRRFLIGNRCVWIISLIPFNGGGLSCVIEGTGNDGGTNCG